MEEKSAEPHPLSTDSYPAPPPYQQPAGTAAYPQQPAASYPPGQSMYPPSGPYPPPPQPAYAPAQQMQGTTTSVVVTSAPQHTTIVRDARSTTPNAWDIVGLVMAICNAFCCFIPLGIAAVIVSGFALAFRCEGKHSTADKLSKISVVLSVIGFILTVVIIVVVVVLVINQQNSYYDY